MFASHFGDSSYIMKEINNYSKRFRVFHNKYIVQGSNISLLKKGDYHYGCTHFPSWKIQEPRDSFTITIFRDPIERIVSHYNYIKGKIEGGGNEDWLAKERPLLGDSFTHFIDNLPPEKLLNQLYNFSENYNLTEAVERIRSLNLILTLENLSEGILDINNMLGLNLKIMKKNMSETFYRASSKEIRYLKVKLEKEIDLFNRLKISFDKK
jgi:hypothetical protein